MAFGSMLDKAKDKAKEAADGAKEVANSAAESAKDASGVITNLVNDINAALPILSEHGFTMNEFEIGLGLMPKAVPHFEFSKDITDEEVEDILKQLEGNKVATLLVKSLVQANNLQKSIKVGNLKFAEVEIEATVPPSVTLKFQ